MRKLCKKHTKLIKKRAGCFIGQHILGAFSHVNGMALNASWKYPENKSKASDKFLEFPAHASEFGCRVLFSWVVSRALRVEWRGAGCSFGD
jgi:hypothetical protein